MVIVMGKKNINLFT